MQTTWMPSTESGVIHNRAELPDSVFAFPRQRKEPLTDADHVRNALARFDQVEGVSDSDRDLAFANIRAAARFYGVELHEKSRRDLGNRLPICTGLKRPRIPSSGRFAYCSSGSASGNASGASSKIFDMVQRGLSVSWMSSMRQ